MAKTSWGLDRSTAFGKRVEQRLRDDPLIWLTTVDSHGAPVPSPVWFSWDGSQVLVYSEPDKLKVRNIEANPRVTLHFDGDGEGGNIVIISGKARIAPQMPRPIDVPEYARKYDAGGFYKRIGMTGEGFAKRYSVPIVIEPVGLRGY